MNHKINLRSKKEIMAEQSRIRYEAKPALNLGPDHDIITTGKSIDEAKADLMIKTFNPAV